MYVCVYVVEKSLKHIARTLSTRKQKYTKRLLAKRLNHVHIDLYFSDDFHIFIGMHKVSKRWKIMIS